MIDHIEAAIDEAINFKNYLERNNKEATLLLSMIELFDKAKLMDHVKFIIENTFVANSLKNIYQQKIGIPMGTNCAPELANLVLYDMEAKHIDNLVSTNRMLDAINLRYTKRYIDDIIVFNTEPIPMTAYDNLQYTEQTEEDGSVIFLGAKLQSRSNRLYISLFDKAKEWNFNVLKYPSADSNTPQHQGKGIYVGELRRYQIMVNSLSAFKQATSNLTKNMATRGYNFKTIKTGWEHFMKKYKDNIFSKRKQRDLRHWYRRMVKWAFDPKPMNTNKYPKKNTVQQTPQTPKDIEEHQHQQEEYEEDTTDDDNENETDNPNNNILYRQELLEKVKQQNDDYVVDLFAKIVKPFGECEIWTEDLIDLYGNDMKDVYMSRKSSIQVIQGRISRNEQILQDRKLMDEEDEDSEDSGSNDAYKLCCILCWQRYMKNYRHTAKLCSNGRILRNLAIHKHQTDEFAEEANNMDF
jgi:hypothetical protein